jgi:hypothetical protein
MKIRSIIFLITFVVFFAAMVLWGVSFLVSKASLIIQQSTPLSPLEDEVLIENSESCIDSDGGVFFDRKGRVSYLRGFLFLKWSSDAVDSCKGNILTEYYCAGEQLKSGNSECGGGCFEGRCL